MVAAQHGRRRFSGNERVSVFQEIILGRINLDASFLVMKIMLRTISAKRNVEKAKAL